MPPAETICDYLVIGAGAAGCVIAGRLSENPNNRVVLVEAGGGNAHPLTKVPGLAFLASVSPKRNWNFRTEPIPALNARTMPWNQGRLVGGSSSINGMIYMRGHSREYDQWAQMGCTGWSFDDVLPFFRKGERNARGADHWHGDAGPIGIRPSGTDLPICDAFLAAAADSGMPVVADMNADVSEGFGRYDINVDQGRRVSAASAYVTPALRRPNFTLIRDALALRVTTEGRRATGAEILHHGRKRIVAAAREVILCGGAINSPQLLLLSGIGPAAELAAVGIPVLLDAPGVGRNLANHPAYSLLYTCRAPITAYCYMRPLQALGIGLRYLLGGRGPLGESYVAQGGVFRTDPALEIADSIVVMAPALVTRGTANASFRDLLPRQHGFAVSVSLGRPRSRGEIRLRSGDPTQHPLIFPNYLSDAQDMRALARAVTMVRAMLRSPAIAGLIERELQPGDVADDEASVEAELRARTGSYSHPMGTCRMGSDDSAVVDPRLRVRGIGALRVADASIIPAPLNACTHGPALMIGEKAAAMILEDWGLAAHAAQGSASR